MLHPRQGARIARYESDMVMHGAYGKVRLAAGQSSSVGDYFRYLIFLEDTIFSAITDKVLDSTQTAFQGDSFVRGLVIVGKFTGLTVTSGKVICLKDVPAE